MSYTESDDNEIEINPHYFLEREKEILINLGSENIYKKDESRTLIKEPNKHFIPSFYSKTDTIVNVTAVVGSNGSGKTTFLKNIINSIYKYDFSCSIIYEKNDNYYSTQGSSFSLNQEGFILRPLKNQDEKEVETIYYSPFLDFSNRVNGIDLSMEFFIEQDSSNLDNIFQNTQKTNFYRAIKFKNTLRFLHFQNSKFFKIDKMNLPFPSLNKNLLSFTRNTIKIINGNEIDFQNHFNNVPKELHFSFNKLYNLIKKNVRINYKSSNYVKELFKDYILIYTSSFILNFLNEKNINLKGYKISNEIIQSKEPINYFIDILRSFNYKINKLYKEENTKNLPFEEVNEFLEYLYMLVDDINYNLILKNERTLELSLEQSLKILELHEKIILKLYSYYPNFQGSQILDRGIINFDSKKKLSSGETALLNLYSRIYDYFKRNVIDKKVDVSGKLYLLCLDEPDMGFHPQWKKEFVKSIVEYFDYFFKKLGAKVQIIFTTHDPLTLSDIPNYNVIYLEKDTNGFTTIAEKPKKSFGANITDLLADSFFVKDGLMGSFAKEKINETIKWLNNDGKPLDKKEYHLKLIENIDEPILKSKLKEMYHNIFPIDEDELELKLLNIKREELLKRIESKQNKN